MKLNASYGHSETFSSKGLPESVIICYKLPYRFSVCLQLLQCDKCQGCYHTHCIGPNYPTKRTRKKVWVCFQLTILTFVAFSNLEIDLSLAFLLLIGVVQ